MSCEIKFWNLDVAICQFKADKFWVILFQGKAEWHLCWDFLRRPQQKTYINVFTNGKIIKNSLEKSDD